MLPACKSHAGGFDVAWVWLWVALLHVSAFILLPSAFAPCPGTIEPRQTPFAISHTYPTRSIGAASAAFCPRRRCLAGGCPVQPRAYSTSRFFVVFGGIGMAAPEAH